MRGKVRCGRTDRTERRITPAYAGKSARNAEKQDSKKDHPRLCGEKFFRASDGYTITGSPPPMRGKVS